MSEDSKNIKKGSSVTADKLEQIIKSSSIKNSALKKILKGIHDQKEGDAMLTNRKATGIKTHKINN